MADLETLNPESHKTGERWLVRDKLYSGRPYEVVIDEWAPSGFAVRLKYQSGSSLWADSSDFPYAIEKLPVKIERP